MQTLYKFLKWYFALDKYNYSNVQKLSQNPAINQFERNGLTAVNNADVVFDKLIYHIIQQLEVVGSVKLMAFLNNRLLISKVPISEIIYLNHYALPSDDKIKKPSSSIVVKHLKIDFFTKLQRAVVYRRQQANKLFGTEIFGTAQCLSIIDTTPYQGYLFGNI